jgi:hypothetical protein
VHARPGRDGVDVQGAAPVRPAFVADDAHHRDLAPCESGGQGRRQRAGCDEAAAPLDRGLLVGRSLSPASPVPWGLSRGADWSRTGRRPTLMKGLPGDAIAARAGVHRTTVQNALREAQGTEGRPGIITVQERRRRGQRSLTNIIRIVSHDWLNWLHKGPSRPAMGVGSKCTAAKKSSTTDTGLFLRGRPSLSIPDGVYPCEEVT